MSGPPQVLLLIGSAKRPRSTSESLGTYLLQRLAERGYATQTLFIYRSLATEAGRSTLLAAVDSAGLVVLATPLYVDSLPALVTRTLESIAEHHRACSTLEMQRLVAIVNCGFPEALHNDTALAICRRFAKETGFQWAGGLGLGGGEAINGRPLSKVKRMARNVIKSLDLAAENLARGEAISQEAVELMAKPFVPNWVYVWLGEWGWRRRAKKFGVQHQLDARPYMRD